MELRKEFEAVFAAVHAAIEKGDAGEFLSLVVPDQMMEESLRDSPEETFEMLRMMTPDLAGVRFLSTETLGDDVAGYYCWRPDPDDKDALQAIKLEFNRSGGAWRMGPLAISAFPRGKGDPEAEVRKRIAEDEDFQLNPAGRAPSGDTGIAAALNVSANGYEVVLAVNGTRLDVKGGCSSGVRLFGAGPEPEEPYVLRRGANEIVAEFRKTDPKSSFPFRLEVFIDGPEPVFRFEDKAAKGVARGSFEV